MEDVQVRWVAVLGILALAVAEASHAIIGWENWCRVAALVLGVMLGYSMAARRSSGVA